MRVEWCKMHTKWRKFHSRSACFFAIRKVFLWTNTILNNLKGYSNQICILLPKSNRFESRTKVETLPKSKGNPLPESRMVLREKISGKVELSLYYALLFHCSGICPVFLLIPHEVLLQTRVLQPKSDRVQGFADDKVERVQSRIGLKVG